MNAANYFRIQGRETGCAVFPFDPFNIASVADAFMLAKQARHELARSVPVARIVVWQPIHERGPWNGLPVIGAT